MEKRYNINRGFVKLISILFVSCLLIACNDDPDDYLSRNKYDLELTSSVDEIILNENTPDDIALTLEWTPAADLGSDYILTYLYEADLVGKKPTGGADPIKEYEDGGVFRRSYTHKELQEMLVDDWLQLTSTTASIQFTITASYKGPALTVPDVSSVSVKIKTYGAIQFSADKLFISGSAIGGEDVEIAKSSSNAQIFVYNGHLSVGTFNFPVIYRDQVKENTISPLTAQQEVTGDAMAAEAKKKEAAGVWVVKEAGDYRVSVNFANRTVSVISASDILEFDKLYLAGTAIGNEIELARTLENDAVYAFKGELSPGSLYLPMLFNGEKELSMVPDAAGNNDIDDGKTVSFAQNQTATAATSNHWNIKTAGTYRIVVDADTKTVTIYSAATDLKPKEVSWNNTVVGQNPFVSKVETLWMYGSYNNFSGDGNGFQGFDNKYTLTQSLANPRIFVYKGDVLPRTTYTDSYGKSSTGAVNFTVSNIHNNVYAFGSTADAERLKYNGYLSVSAGATQTIVAGQAHNRYAYFLIPEGTNYVMVDIENLIVVFDKKP